MPEPKPKTCSRCGTSVPSILSGPPGDEDRWMRNSLMVERREVVKTKVTHRLKCSIWHRQWWPENPMDQVRETYTHLDLCDDCAAAVFMFAQNLPSNRDGLKEAPDGRD